MEVLTRVDREQIARLLEADEFFWLDLIEPSPDDIEALQQLLGIHPAAVEDTKEWEQIPKLDDYGDHVMLVFYSARAAGERLEPVEVHVYVAGGFMATFRRAPSPLDDLHDVLAADAGEAEEESLYKVLNALADGWDPVIDELDRRVDAVETEVLDRPRKDHLATIYRLKQNTHELARPATKQRDLMPVAVDVILSIPGLSHGSKEWLRDVTTHMEAIAGELSRSSEDLLALTSTFFNASAYRLNRLATLIAVGSVFFLVWTLVTSFFGQNFKYLVDSVSTRHDFLVFGVGGLVVPTLLIGVVFYIRRRDWM